MRHEYHVFDGSLFFHPDYNRRLWLFTKSADLSLKKKRSRAVCHTGKITAGGELHPALKIIRLKVNVGSDKSQWVHRALQVIKWSFTMPTACI